MEAKLPQYAQMYLFKDYSPKPEPEDSVILFHLPKEAKDRVSERARLRGLSVTALLNGLISDYITCLEQPEKKKTGRGNIDLLAVLKAKELMRMKHQQGVRLMEIARHVGCSSARARGIIDLFSDADRQSSFLVYEDCESDPVLYYIYRDDEMN